MTHMCVCIYVCILVLWSVCIPCVRNVFVLLRLFCILLECNVFICDHSFITGGIEAMWQSVHMHLFRAPQGDLWRFLAKRVIGSTILAMLHLCLSLFWALFIDASESVFCACVLHLFSDSSIIIYFCWISNICAQLNAKYY